MKGEPLTGQTKELHGRLTQLVTLLEENEEGLVTWHNLICNAMAELIEWWYGDTNGIDTTWVNLDTAPPLTVELLEAAWGGKLPDYMRVLFPTLYPAEGENGA